MEIASWGPKSFSVDTGKFTTFRGLALTAALSTEAQANEGDKPATYIKGNELETLSLVIPLYARFANVREEINAWRGLMGAQTPYAFLVGGVKLGDNMWLLTGVSLGNTVIGAGGVMTSAELNLTFQEYVRKGTKPASTTSSSSRKKAKEPTADEINALFAAEMAMADKAAPTQPSSDSKRVGPYVT